MTHPPGSHRVRPTAYPLLHLAHEAVRGHKMIAERIAEHAAEVTARREAERAAAGAVRAHLAVSGNGADGGTPAAPVG